MDLFPLIREACELPDDAGRVAVIDWFAGLCCVDRDTVYRWIAAGKINRPAHIATLVQAVNVARGIAGRELLGLDDALRLGGAQ